MKNQLLYSILVSSLFFSCSVEKKSITSLAWHNTNAHYNGYYLAKEKIKEAENTIYNSKKDNFNRILNIYTPLDESISSSIDPLLEESIKKASLPIQYHKNSKWVDNCYILIGKSRFYKLDYENAIITFKYVNTISEDEQDKAEALIWLARSFVATEQMEFAMGVINHVRKIELNKKNAEFLALTECEIYQKLDYLKPLSKNIEIAANNSTSRRNKARSNFIAGQVFQKSGDDEKAFYHYKKCLRTNPPYELEFYSKLNMAQVTSFESSKDIKKIKKYFKKLLKDFKNVDFKDKIYYEMAKFELKQNKIKPAIEYLNSSIQASTSNLNQKAYSYLKLGKIYYEDLQEYRKASNYYDSTMQFLSKDEPDYLEIKKRTKILKDFVTQLEIIEREDSLQVLAKMDSSELIILIDNNIRIKKEKEKKRLLALQIKKEKAKNEIKTDDDNALNSPNSWYFYNASSLAKGQTEFIQNWGNRKLTDHWRRANQDEFNEDELDDTSIEEDSNSIASLPTAIDPKEKEEKEIIKLRKKVIKTIPFTEAQLKISNKKIELAYSRLGSIYHLKLIELIKAAETYETLLQRFPNHKNKIEVYYILFIINGEIDKPRSDYYKNLLLTKYPNTIYAKLVLDPEYLVKNWELNKQAELMYSDAYDLYETGNFHKSIIQCDEVEKQYPENYIHDKIQLLKILNTSKIEGIIAYKKELIAYIKKFKDSPLKTTATSYLKECNEYIIREVNGGNVAKDIGEIEIYDQNIDEEQYFILIIPQNKGIILNDVLVNISDFNTSFTSISQVKLEVKQMIFNTDYLLILVKKFKNKEEGLKYRDKINIEKIIEKKDLDVESFVITKKNFSKLYKTKAREEYSSFFKKSYF